ncbi:hypothetical protein [Candidatus Methylocalor cossyra]
MRNPIAFNFQLAVWLSILGGIATLVAPDLIFPDDIRDPLHNIFLIIIGYLVVGQLGLWACRYSRGSRSEALVMAYTFLATAVGAKFFAMRNDLPLADGFIVALLYLGGSHALYYFAAPGKTETSPISDPGTRGREPKT